MSGYEKNARLARQEGKKEGIEEGIIKGKRECVKEYQSETVRNLLDMDLPHDKIAKATGLQLSEVEALAAAR